jgi:hypothetical protein
MDKNQVKIKKTLSPLFLFRGWAVCKIHFDLFPAKNAKKSA